MNPFERYGETLGLIASGCDTIRGVAEHTGKPHPTVEAHFQKLRRRGLITGHRSMPNDPKLYSLTPSGEKWLNLVETLGAANDIDHPALVVGQEDDGITAELYRWARLSPPVPHKVVGRVHRLLSD